MDAVIAHINSLDPSFLSEHPEQHFALLRCRYASLVAAGDMLGALTLARSQLAPLADKHPALQPALKVGTYFQFCGHYRWLPVHSLVSSAQKSVQGEPPLMSATQ